MDLSAFFEPKRFSYFMKQQWGLGARNRLIEFGSLAGLLLILTIGQWLSAYEYQFSAFRQFGAIAFFAGGILLTAQTFSELRDPGKALLYMNLPASVFEKVAAMWLFRALFFTIAVYTVLTLMSVVCGWLSAVTVGASWQIFNPFNYDNLSLAAHFLVWQSVFMFGAVYFKNNNFFKTAFSLIGIGLFCFLWLITIAYLTGEFYGIGSPPFGFQSDDNALSTIITTVKQVLTILYGCIAPFCWVLTYFHLKEREF